MSEQYAESLYGPPPEGDGPQGEELVTDPGDAPSYAVLSPTPPSPGRIELEALLRSAINLPAHPSDEELSEALGTAASVLWGAGYRRILQ
jgi:hypothetical protein